MAAAIPTPYDDAITYDDATPYDGAVNVIPAVLRGLLESEGGKGGYLVKPKFRIIYASEIDNAAPDALSIEAWAALQHAASQKRRRKRDEEAALFRS